MNKINKLRNEKGEVTTENAEIQRIIRDYYEQLYESPKCSKMGQCSNKMCYVHTIVYLLSNKKKKLRHAAIWMVFGGIRLHEQSQSQKGTFCIISLIYIKG